MKFKPNLKKVPLNFCGVDLFVVQWNIRQLQAFQEAIKGIDGMSADILLLFVKDSLVDADGHAVSIDNFDELDIDSVNGLLKIVLEVNGLGEKKDSTQNDNLSLSL